MSKVKVTFVAEMDEALLGKFLQYIRDFDTTHAGCHFKMFAQGDMETPDIEAMFDKLTPEFPIREKWSRKKK